MRKSVLVLTTVVVTITLLLYLVSNPAAKAVDDSDIRAGLWQDGKAAFSDVNWLDPFGGPYRRGYRPEQPIHYSHKLHIQKNNLECQYCHSGVAKSPYAGVPPLELCMGCHKVVKTAAQSTEIKKLADAYEQKKPVEWEPVHHLPEHVYFTHERHMKAGVGCQRCHGQVQQMEVVEKISSMKMGFCVSCHREYGATLDCLFCHR